MSTSTISNTILDLSGTAVADVTVVVTLMPSAGFREDTFTEVARSVTTTTDSNGLWSLALERNSNITPEGTYYIVDEHIPASKGGATSNAIQVGDSNQTVLAALISNLPTFTNDNFLTQEAADARYAALDSIGDDTPTTIEPDDAADAGVSTAASRGDHTHAIVAAAASGLSLDSTSTEGDATSFARSNHTHALTINPPACRVRRTTSQSITSGARTAISFDAERYDTDSMWEGVTNPTRITFTTAGLYLITAHLEWDDNADGDGVRNIEIRANGSDTQILAIETSIGTANTLREHSVSTVMKFAATNYVELTVFQNSGSTQAINTSAMFTPEFSATWIGTGE